MENRRIDRSTPSASGVLLVFLLLAAAVMANWGFFTWHAFPVILCALALAMWLHVRPEFNPVSSEALLLGILLAFMAMMLSSRAGQNEVTLKFHLPGVPSPWVRFNTYGRSIRIGSGIGLMIGLTYLVRAWDRRRRIMVGRFVALVILAVALRGLILLSSPIPIVDLFVSQTAAGRGLILELTPEAGREEKIRQYTKTTDEAQALRENRNVYAMQFSSPYRGQRWFDHYAYPPPTVYMNALGWWGFKDVRVSWVFCDLVGALCLFLLAARVNPGSGQTRFRQLITLTFLFMPRSLFVLEQSFTEPLTVASLGVFAVLLARPTHPVLCGIIMGLLFSTKQYVVLAAPLIFKLRQRLLMWLVAALAAVALFLPFILWNWDAMYDDLIGFFLKSKGRSDALSICGAMKRIAHAAWGINYEIPWMVVAPLWVGGLVFFTWKMKRSFAGMLFSTASLWLFFFIFGKQAFMNYWYLILFALLLAVAAVPRGAPPSDRVSREEST